MQGRIGAEIKDQLERWIDWISVKKEQPLASGIFFRSLAAYTLIKIILLAGVLSEILQLHQIDLPKQKSSIGFLFLLSAWINASPVTFFIVSILILSYVIWLGANYITNFMLAWICLNLYVVNFTTGDGSDLILLMLSLYAIPLTARLDQPGSSLEIVLFNASRLLIQIYVAFIYVNSGIDKLMSPSWVSGDAMDKIRHYEGLYNTTFPTFLQGQTWDLILSWATILVELFIAIFIWQRTTRPIVLILAVIFHLIIWWMVSLPDFAVLMIVSLLIFTEDNQYDWLKRKIRQ